MTLDRADTERAVTFFERYFAALDGPDPHSSLELVSEDVEFAIQWATGADRKSTQILGGLAELRQFIDAGDMGGWAHYVLHAAEDGGVAFALGETRYDSGERIGTFTAAAQLDAAGRMRKYFVARTPAIDFDRAGSGDREVGRSSGQRPPAPLN